MTIGVFEDHQWPWLQRTKNNMLPLRPVRLRKIKNNQSVSRLEFSAM